MGIDKFSNSKMSFLWPVLALILLAPFSAEILSGSTPISEIYGLIFFIPLYGFGALLIREIAVKYEKGWSSILLMGIAFGLIEEGLIVKVIFDPSLLSATNWGFLAGGELFGIYWIFTLAVVTYHAI